VVRNDGSGRRAAYSNIRNQLQSKLYCVIASSLTISERVGYSKCVALFFLSDLHTKHNIPADYQRHFLFPRNMATPNEEATLKARIQQAKTFLQEHDNETITTAARIFKIPRTTLTSSIHRQYNTQRQGGLNRILTSGQEEAINQFI
jgi:hypothetical protein